LTHVVTRRETTDAGGAITAGVASGLVADAGAVSGDGLPTAATAAAATAAAAGDMVGETTEDTSRQKRIL
jgi:hypothetical protein